MVLARVPSVSRFLLHALTLAAILCSLGIARPEQLFAQTYPPAQPRDSARDTAAAKPVQAPPIDFSGILFANYSYRGGSRPARSSNRFDVERAYLTFRMPAGERTSIRVTTDLFQQTTPGNDSYYRGWTVRAKYAYLQYNYLNGPEWRAFVRGGLLQTVFIEHDELFWPRWISNSPAERAGFFASADAGISTTISLPRKAGEVYAAITNGPGYTSREIDRFKDYAARLTLTPWANTASSALKTLALSGWYYKGALASAFVSGGPGQIGPVGSSLVRDRWGVHLGSLSPHLTLGIEYGGKRDEGEAGLNTPVSPRTVTDSTGALFAGYALVRPFASSAESAASRLTLMARWDQVTTNTDTDWRYNVFITGLIWDISKRASISLDRQENDPRKGSPIARSTIYYAHLVARY